MHIYTHICVLTHAYICVCVFAGKNISMHCIIDNTILHQGHNALSKWSNKWLLIFHKDECIDLEVGRKKKQYKALQTNRVHDVDTSINLPSCNEMNFVLFFINISLPKLIFIHAETKPTTFVILPVGLSITLMKTFSYHFSNH